MTGNRNSSNQSGNSGRTVELVAWAVATVAIVTVLRGFIVPLALPAAALTLDGDLAEATVLSLAPTSSSQFSRAASVRFTAEVDVWSIRHAFKPARYTIESEIPLPADIAKTIRPGDKLIVTYHPTAPTVVRYGAVNLGWISGRNLAIVFAAVAGGAFLSWFIQHGRRLSADGITARAPFYVLIGAFATGLSYSFLMMSQPELRWELGMRFDKYAAPTMISAARVRSSGVVATYTFTTKDGLQGTREREFSAFEIDDAGKMKIGRRFSVVYFGSNPTYNRPDWVEDLIAPTRWITIVVAGVAGFEYLAIVLIAVFFLMRGPPPPRRSKTSPEVMRQMVLKPAPASAAAKGHYRR